MSEKYYMETEETSNEIQLNEMLYNCCECSSPIEILSIDEISYTIEFYCRNNTHQINMYISDYIDEMKKYNNKNLNNDICDIHNNKYDCFCFDCNKHLCKECLKSRDHINHKKNNIIELQPNKNELNIIEDIIRFYEDKIEKLEKEKINKTSEINLNNLKKN